MNIFIAAQRGDVETIKSLVESGKATVLDRDNDQISPLHWAAINGQMAACRYLLDQGADVDPVGGDLVATPLQWAARCAVLLILIPNRFFALALTLPPSLQERPSICYPTAHLSQC